MRIFLISALTKYKIPVKKKVIQSVKIIILIINNQIYLKEWFKIPSHILDIVHTYYSNKFF